MRILITGGAGFLGLNLTQTWLNADPSSKITILDTFDHRFQNNPEYVNPFRDKVKIIHGSILDSRLLSDIIPHQDIIYHCAAQSSHILSIQDPLFDAETNILGTLKLLEAIRLFQPTATIVYPSSTTVLGKSPEIILDENQPEKPLDIYSANKSAAEKYFHIYHKVHGIKSIVLRFSNLYGPFGKESAEFGFINYFISQATKNKGITIYGSGSQLRNTLYVEDATRLLISAVNYPALIGQITQATSPFHYSVKEIAESIVKIFESESEVTFGSWPQERKSIDVESVQFSSEKIRALTGWQCENDLQTGLLKTRLAFQNFLQNSNR